MNELTEQIQFDFKKINRRIGQVGFGILLLDALLSSDWLKISIHSNKCLNIQKTVL